MANKYVKLDRMPENTLSATAPALEALRGRGAVLLSGPEPNFRWRSFCDAVAETARDLGAEMVVTMGALLADVPHSRPVSVAANSQDADLSSYVQMLEERFDSQVEGGERNLPTGDDLAQELEGFLRDQRNDEE